MKQKNKLLKTTIFLIHRIQKIMGTRLITINRSCLILCFIFANVKI